MPFLKKQAEKADYLDHLEDLYYDKVDRDAHGMDAEEADWSQLDL